MKGEYVFVKGTANTEMYTYVHTLSPHAARPIATAIRRCRTVSRTALQASHHLQHLSCGHRPDQHESLDIGEAHFMGAAQLIVGLDALRHRRSEERRVGKECVSTCRSRWWTYH